MKKGRGETAPTFLIITSQTPVPVHPWSKAKKRRGDCEQRYFLSLTSNADVRHIGCHCVLNKFTANVFERNGNRA
jgi:hypothetical protein